MDSDPWCQILSIYSNMELEIKSRLHFEYHCDPARSSDHLCNKHTSNQFQYYGPVYSLILFVVFSVTVYSTKTLHKFLVTFYVHVSTDLLPKRY